MKKQTKNKLENIAIIIGIVIAFVIILGIEMVSAVNDCGNENSYLGTFKQGETIILRQTCDDCSYVNLSAVTYPNSTTINYDTNMTKNGIEYSISSTDTPIFGCYSYSVYGDKGGVLTSENVDYRITQSGMNSTTGGSIVYIALLALLIFLFIINAIGITKLPHGNPRADSGNILSISLLKYLKPTLIVLGWGIIIAVLLISSNIAEAYLGHSVSNFLFQLFRISTFFAYPVLLLWIIYTVVHIFKDVKLKQFFDRGYSPT